MPSNPVAWLHGDQEYYPVWPTTLWEQDQIWRTKFGLRTSEQRIERLAQEAALYVICMGVAHDKSNETEDLRVEGLLDWDELEDVSAKQNLRMESFYKDLMQEILDRWLEDVE